MISGHREDRVKDCVRRDLPQGTGFIKSYDMLCWRSERRIQHCRVILQAEEVETSVNAPVFQCVCSLALGTLRRVDDP